MSEPNTLHLPYNTHSGSAKVGPSALFLAGAGILLCFAAVQFSNPILSIGALSVGTAVATIAGRVFFSFGAAAFDGRRASFSRFPIASPHCCFGSARGASSQSDLFTLIVSGLN